jgi:DNA (cytosine-5)-methyltransferase 1
VADDRRAAVLDPEGGVVRLGSLFSGAGGLDLAVEAHTGARTVWQCEQDPDASRVLAARFGAPNLGDITAVDWTTVEPVDVLCGGFPCQDISNAGKRAGITGARSGLWSFYADAVRVLRPRHVYVENVGPLLVRGLGTVLGDLAALGYDASWGCVLASDAGAAHRRERVFIVATDAARERLDGAGGAGPGRRPEPTDGGAGAGLTLMPTPAARDSKGRALDRQGGDSLPDAALNLPPAAHFGPYTAAIRRWEQVLGRPAPPPTEPGRDGRARLSARFVEWLMGLPDGWVTGVDIPRNAQLKALGNGVVPQQALLALDLLDPRC